MVVWTLYIVLTLANGSTAVYTAEYHKAAECNAAAVAVATIEHVEASGCAREIGI
jgi:hypothetical protein